jgi:hypothetical protein
MLLTILPNWDSLDSVRQAHSDLELAGIVFFALLVVAEALAHNSEHEKRRHLFDSIGIWFFAIAVLCELAGYEYGQRNDALSERIIRSLDVEARDASTSASTALEKSGTALGNSKEAETKSSDAVDKAGKAQEKAGSAEDTAGEALGNSNMAIKQASDAQAQLAAVDAKRAELEQSLTTMAVCTAPRVLPIWTMVGVKAAVDPLKPFATYRAIIEFVPNDAEARRAASNIFVALKQAGWTTVTITPVDNIGEGVEIQPSVPIPGDKGSQEAADALVDFLHSYFWQAKPGWLLDENNFMIVDPKVVPPNTLRIRVGLYPAVSLVVPPGAKDFADAMRQVEQARENQIEQSEQEQAKKDEEFLKKLTPQQAKKFIAEDKEWKQRLKAMMGRYTQPCQPLNGLVSPFR